MYPFCELQINVNVTIYIRSLFPAAFVGWLGDRIGAYIWGRIGSPYRLMWGRIEINRVFGQWYKVFALLYRSIAKY
jgi:hypothetical protein